MRTRFFGKLVAVAWVVHWICFQSTTLHPRSISLVKYLLEENATDDDSVGNHQIQQNVSAPFQLEENATDDDSVGNHQIQQNVSAPFQFPQLSNKDTKVIFYHIYLPTGRPQLKNAHRIVREQMQQMGGQDKDVTVLYNTIGKYSNGNVTRFTSLVTEWCHEYNLTACHHLKHYERGLEVKTLQSVYNFCQAQNHGSANSNGRRVGYLHNKGSHHGHDLNNVWRYLMTEALVRDECWRTTEKTLDNNNTNPQCNICGLFFTPDWGLYFSGNMWAADCSYINRLIPPSQFEAQSRDAFKDALLREKMSQFQMTLLKVSSLYTVGIGRYAAEWWTGSHPSIRPCDFSASVQHWMGHQSSNLRNATTDAFLAWMRAHKGAGYQQKAQQLLTNFTAQASEFPSKFPEATWRKNDKDMKHEYFLLPGRIHRWIHLYGQLPEEDSWLWKIYPQGAFWRQETKKHGLQVLDKVIPMDEWAVSDMMDG